MAERFDRRRQDIGNILGLEHVNLWVPDQRIATAFYVTGLGLTRDPYVMVGTENMWINIGAQQFHLPTNKPQVLRGVVGLVVQHFDALPAQLESVRGELAGTQFAWSVEDKHIAVTSPWGNRLRCYAPGPWGDLTL
ncbi:MAG: VOC family protein, partial [Candidatus Rokuibacteriota bacterium]